MNPLTIRPGARPNLAYCATLLGTLVIASLLTGGTWVGGRFENSRADTKVDYATDAARSNRAIVDMHQFPWSSIGKVGSAGQQCTGSVIGPSQFLTAAHCLYMKRTGRFLPADSINFLLGYQKGEYRVRRIASRYLIAAAFDPSHYSYPLDQKKLKLGARDDWAIVYVAEPFPADVKPLRLASTTPSPGTKSAIAGYPVERRHLLTADRQCRVLEISSDKKLITDNCVTRQGDSGGPLLSQNDEGLVILGVNILAPELRVDIEQSKTWRSTAVSAANISAFLDSTAH